MNSSHPEASNNGDYGDPLKEIRYLSAISSTWI